MAYRIFLTGTGIAEQAREALREHGCIVECGDARDSEADLIRKLSAFDPDALIVRQGRITAEVQAAAPGLKVICKHGVGTDNIDIDAATRRGIPVLFTPGTNADAAAEHTLALILSLTRQIPRQDARIRSGIFDKKGYDGLELRGRTVGLIGFGRIARRVAELLAPFHVDVRVYHPSATEEALPRHITKVGGVEEIFRTCDVISLHCPLTDDTRNLIDGEAIARMRRGVLLINTARGGLIDEDALVRALRDGHVGGAALDVFQSEPLPPDHALRDLGTVVLTTHVAGISERSFVNMGMQSVHNVLAALERQPLDPATVVNPEVLTRVTAE